MEGSILQKKKNEEKNGRKKVKKGLKKQKTVKRDEGGLCVKVFAVANVQPHQ